MISLRPYQQDLIERLRDEYRAGHSRVLLQSPTGSGKTTIFAFIAKSALEKGQSVTIIAHRREILEQISATLKKANVPRGDISVISVQKLVRELDKRKKPDLLVVDEAHHCVSESYVRISTAYESSRFLGVTATPERLDGRGLGERFSSLVKGPTVEWLISQGFLAQPIYYAPRHSIDTSGLRKVAGDYSKSESAALVDKPSITGDIIEHYQRLASGRTGIVFCVNLGHAENVAAAFRAAGIRAARIDGKLSDEDRAERVADLSSGALQVLTSCEIVSEGFDLPAVGAAVLARPTASLALHLQQIGRSLRPAPGKADAIILDHVGNCLRHGLAEEPREWSLEGRSASRRTKEAVLETRQCEKCYAIFWGLKCPQCGTERASKVREIEEREGELARLDAAAIAAARDKRRAEGRAQSLEDLLALEKARGYKHGWAFHRWKARQARSAPPPPETQEVLT